MCMWRVFLALGTDKSESHSILKEKLKDKRVREINSKFVHALKST